MPKYSLTTPVYYNRNASKSEKFFSAVSQYLSLDKTKAVVIKNNQIKFENRNIPWYITALKVISYMLWFPITFGLLVFNFIMHKKYKFTVLNSDQSSNKVNKNIEKINIPNIPNKILINPKFENPKSKTPIIPKDEKSIPHFIPHKKISKQPSFQSFKIQIDDKEEHDISNIDKAKELSDEVNKKHISMKIKILQDNETFKYSVKNFIKQLMIHADVERITNNINILRIKPKIKNMKVAREGIYRFFIEYQNGIIEHRDSCLALSQQRWKGTRTYLNGKKEEGEFDNFRLVKGKCIENEKIYYYCLSDAKKDALLYDSVIKQGILLDKSKLVIIEEKILNNNRIIYVPLEKELIPTFINMIETDSSVLISRLNIETIIRYIDQEKFIKALCKSSIFKSPIAISEETFSKRAILFNILKILIENVKINKRQRTILQNKIITLGIDLLPPFKMPVEIYINDKKNLILSWKEMQIHANQLTKQSENNHTYFILRMPDVYDYDKRSFTKYVFQQLIMFTQAQQRKNSEDSYVIMPQIEKIDEKEKICYYKNGVIEKVISGSRDLNDLLEFWEGERIYNNGTNKIEKGEFKNFELYKGTCLEKGKILYYLPEVLFGNYEKRCIIIAKVNNKKQLIATKEIDNLIYTPLKEELIPAIIKILQTTNDHYSLDSRGFSKILSLIDYEKFIKNIFKSNIIFSLTSKSFCLLLKVLNKHEKLSQLKEKLYQKHPKTKKNLLEHYFERYFNDSILILLEFAPNLFKNSLEEKKESLLVNFLLTGINKFKKKLYQKLHDKIIQNNIQLSDREILLQKIALPKKPTDIVALENLKKLSPKDREIAFRLANMYFRLKIILQMRKLGFKRTEPLLKDVRSSLFAYNMDALEMAESLQQFFIKLKKSKRILTESEFNKLPNKEDYIVKGYDISRLLGRNYIEEKVNELELKHVKVPEKLIVIPDKTKNIKVKIQADPSGITIVSYDFLVYAKKINYRERSITYDEVSELIEIFEKTGYTDIHKGNIIIAEDGVYIIDTEFNNFWLYQFGFEKGKQYFNMSKIVHLLPTEKQERLIKFLKDKIKTYIVNESKYNEYKKLSREKFEKALKKTGCKYIIINMSTKNFSIDFKN